MKDSVCGNCGSCNVHHLLFDSDAAGRGFQEFECRECGANTYQTFTFTITSEEVTLSTPNEKESCNETE